MLSQNTLAITAFCGILFPVLWKPHSLFLYCSLIFCNAGRGGCYWIQQTVGCVLGTSANHQLDKKEQELIPAVCSEPAIDLTCVFFWWGNKLEKTIGLDNGSTPRVDSQTGVALNKVLSKEPLTVLSLVAQILDNFIFTYDLYLNLSQWTMIWKIVAKFCFAIYKFYKIGLF